MSDARVKDELDTQMTVDGNGGHLEDSRSDSAAMTFHEQKGATITESDRLKDLQAEVRDQDDLERDIGLQADMLLFEKANERDQQRLEKTSVSKQKLELQIRKLRERVSQPIGITQRAKLKNDIDRFLGLSDSYSSPELMFKTSLGLNPGCLRFLCDMNCMVS